MNASGLRDLRVVELKEKLKALGLCTTGAKSELILRLQRSGYCESEMENYASETMPRATSELSEENPILNASLDLMRREKELAERELELARREIEFLRRMQNLSLAQPIGSVVPETARDMNLDRGPPLERKLRMGEIGELLGPFNGSRGTFERWERQLRWLRDEHQLVERETKYLVGSSIKGDALEWFHSRPEHLEMSVDRLLEEMRNMYTREPGKAERRTRFEERTWRRTETFAEYYHEKVLLANAVPIDEEEMVENLIRGIPDPDLRDQARMHRFETKTSLLKAFEYVAWRNRSTSGLAGTAREDRRPRGATAEHARRDNRWREHHPARTTTFKARCWSCGSRDHDGAECPTKEKGYKCFACHGFGHKSKDCPSKQSKAGQQTPVQNCIDLPKADAKYFEDVMINGFKLTAMLDTGSDLSLISVTKYAEISASPLQLAPMSFDSVGAKDRRTLGVFKASIEIDGVQHPIVIRIVPDDYMPCSFMLGAQFLTKPKIQARKDVSLAEPLEGHRVPEIFSVTCDGTDIPFKLNVESAEYSKAVEPMVEAYRPVKTCDVPVEKTIVTVDDETVCQRACEQLKEALPTKPVLKLCSATDDDELRRILELAAREQNSDHVGKRNVLYRVTDDDARIVVPRAMEIQVIRRAYERGHSAVTKTKILWKRDFWFPNLRTKIEKVIRNCVDRILGNRKSGKQKGLLNISDKGYSRKTATNCEKKATKTIAKLQAENRQSYNRKRIPAKRYREGEIVAIQRTQPGQKFASKFLGPYSIVKILRNDRYLVERVGEHEGPRQTSVAADHLKPWASEEESADSSSNNNSDSDSKCDNA